MRSRLLVILVLVCVSLVGASPRTQTSDTDALPELWRPFERLIGTWRGTSDGRFGPATLERTWSVVLDGQFLRSTTRSVSDLEIHEDVGMLSYDRDRQRYVLREFYSEGYVNRFLLRIENDGDTFVFETEAVENGYAPGLRALTHLHCEQDGALTSTLALATGDAPYETCITSTLTRAP